MSRMSLLNGGLVRNGTEQSSSVVDHDLTLVIPAYNEESRLPRTLLDARTFLDDWGIDYRVLVIDDGSTDKTADLTASYGRRFSTIRQPNGGKGSAVRRGMLASRGRIVAFTDADLPYDLAALRSAYDDIRLQKSAVVFGSRNVDGAECLVERRVLRTIASFVFRSIVTQLVSRQATDTQCGLKVFSHRAAQLIFSRTTVDGFAFDAEVVYLAHLLQLPFRKVPVTLINEYATTISLTRNAVPMLLDVLRVRLRALRGEYRLHDADLIEQEVDPASAFRKAA